MTEPELLQPLSDSQRETLEEAVAAYEADLTDEAQTYLAGRWLTPRTVGIHRLGVVADPMPGHDRFRNMLAIPYLDKDNKPLTIRFRCIENHDHRAHYHGKYMSIPDDPARMYNIGAIHRAGDIIHVTEGEFDAMVLQQIGYHAVAMPGASSFQGRHRRMLAGFSRVWVWGDPDDAGADFINKVTRRLRTAKGVKLAYGDVSDTYVFDGEDALHALVCD